MKGGGKVLLLISDDRLFDFMKRELEKCGFEVEELLYMILHCGIVVLDYFYLQSGIADYLKGKGMKKPIFLILTQTQMHSTHIRMNELFQDILVMRDPAEGDSRTLISALRGEANVQSLFEAYLSKFPVENTSGRWGKAIAG